MASKNGYIMNDRFDIARDMKGYGQASLHPQWPNGARIAISFVINYEEGAENCVLNGDAGSEIALAEAPGVQPLIGERSLNTESEYEYGSRAGVWRLLRLFERYNMKYTLYAVGKALEDNPEVGIYSAKNGHEVASHAYRWIDYHNVPVDVEKDYIRKCIKTIESICGTPPKGWYIGRLSPRSRGLIWEVYKEMDIPLLWSSDTYADDVPYWIDLPAERDEPNPQGLLMVPYTFDCNDWKFTQTSGFSGPQDFEEHLKNAFDTLYEEGTNGMPKMMTVGLHCRQAGKPGRFPPLKRFVEYIEAKEGVWVATRTDIAEHFRSKFPYRRGHLA